MTVSFKLGGMMPGLLGGGDAARAERVSTEMFKQKKPDLAALERAARG